MDPPHRTLVTNAALVAALLLVGWTLLPLWQPLLFASILAAVLWPLQRWLMAKLGERRHVAAGLTSIAVVVLILTPLTIVGIIAVRQTIEAVDWIRDGFGRGGLPAIISPLPDHIERWLRPWLERVPRELRSISRGPTTEAGRWAAEQVQSLVATVSTFAFDLVIMLIALFFLLADGRRLVDWVRRHSPIGRSRTQELLDEFRVVSRAVIGASFITGLAQASVATIGYYICRVPQPLFFGLLTLLTSFIPSVGTAIIALPLAGLLLLLGHPWASLFLALWAVLIVAMVDNVLRPLLIRNDLNVHGALVFFVIIGGIAIFGLAGLAVGPLALVFFLTMMRFYVRDVRNALRTPPPIVVDQDPKS